MACKEQNYKLSVFKMMTHANKLRAQERVFYSKGFERVLTSISRSCCLFLIFSACISDSIPHSIKLYSFTVSIGLCIKYMDLKPVSGVLITTGVVI